MLRPKSCCESGYRRVALERLAQELGVDDVDAHRRERDALAPRHRLRLLRLLVEAHDAMIGTERHDAELVRLRDRHLHAADRDVGAALLVERDQRPVVHLVDVIAGENQHRLGAMLMNDVEILVNRIGRAAIPNLTELLLRRHDVDELAELAVQVAPAALHMLNQGVRLILREDEDLADARVDAVRQREVDDAVLAAERRGRLGTMVRQLHEPLTAAARHDDGDGAASELTDETSARNLSHFATRYYLRTPPV